MAVVRLVLVGHPDASVGRDDRKAVDARHQHLPARRPPVAAQRRRRPLDRPSWPLLLPLRQLRLLLSWCGQRIPHRGGAIHQHHGPVRRRVGSGDAQQAAGRSCSAATTSSPGPAGATYTSTARPTGSSITTTTWTTTGTQALRTRRCSGATAGRHCRTRCPAAGRSDTGLRTSPGREKMAGNLIGAVPGGPQAPLCGYEGDNIALSARATTPVFSGGWSMPQTATTPCVTGKATRSSTPPRADTPTARTHRPVGLAAQRLSAVPLRPDHRRWTRIQNKNEPGGQPGKFVDAGSTCESGANVQLWSPDPQRCQQFSLQPIDDVLLVSASTGSAVGGRGCREPSGGGPPGRRVHRSVSAVAVPCTPTTATSASSAAQAS